MNEQAILRGRLSKIEALLARPGNEGERIAAEAAVARIQERLGELQSQETLAERLFPFGGIWTTDAVTLLRSQRRAADRLYRQNLAMARGAQAFMRIMIETDFTDVFRFWSGAGSGD